MKQSPKILHYNLFLQPEPEGGFTVIVPSLPGCVTYGRTIAEAKNMARDAISAYLGSLKKHGENVPTDTNAFMSTVDVAVGEHAYA